MVTEIFASIKEFFAFLTEINDPEKRRKRKRESLLAQKANLIEKKKDLENRIKSEKNAQNKKKLETLLSDTLSRISRVRDELEKLG